MIVAKVAFAPRWQLFATWRDPREWVLLGLRIEGNLQAGPYTVLHSGSVGIFCYGILVALLLIGVTALDTASSRVLCAFCGYSDDSERVGAVQGPCFFASRCSPSFQRTLAAGKHGGCQLNPLWYACNCASRDAICTTRLARWRYKDLDRFYSKDPTIRRPSHLYSSLLRPSAHSSLFLLAMFSRIAVIVALAATAAMARPQIVSPLSPPLFYQA